MNTNYMIYKYPFDLDKRSFELQLPIDHKVLTVQMQIDIACMWVMLDPMCPTQKYTFYINGTGEPMQVNANGSVGRYLGTIQDGPYVWHIFAEND